METTMIITFAGVIFLFLNEKFRGKYIRITDALPLGRSRNTPHLKNLNHLKPNN